MAVLATLYFTSGLLGQFGNVQIVSMIDWQNSGLGWHLHIWYAIALISCSASLAVMAFNNNNLIKALSVVLSLMIITVTAIGILTAMYNGKNPALYENYIGELITIVLSIMATAVVMYKNNNSNNIA